MSPAGYIGLGVGAVVVALLVAFYLWVARRNRGIGGHGVVTRSRLTCPNCHQTFDYDYIPGVSFTAVRLGSSRYMACPLCRRWSTFDLTDTQPRIGGPPGP